MEAQPRLSVCRAIPRRGVLLGTAVLLTAGPGRVLAEEASPPGTTSPPAVAFPAPLPPPPAPTASDPTIFQYDFASDVPNNLRVREYCTIITSNRARVWQLIAQQIQAGDFGTLSMNLNVAPAADLRQAALYIPWALMQNNEFNAAIDSRKAFNDFDEHVKDLQRAAASAAALAAAAADAQQPVPPAQQQQLAQKIQQAFILMSASLDGFLQAVPAKYTAGAARQAVQAQQQQAQAQAQAEAARAQAIAKAQEARAAQEAATAEQGSATQPQEQASSSTSASSSSTSNNVAQAPAPPPAKKQDPLTPPQAMVFPDAFPPQEAWSPAFMPF